MDAKIQRFWHWFATSKKLSQADSTSLMVDLIYDAIVKIDGRFAIEVSEPDSEGGRELIISANGYLDLFDLVERVVRTAPVIDGWKWIELKPARGFDFIFRADGLELRPSGWSFLPLRGDQNELDLRVYIPGDLVEISPTNLAIIIETGIGERAFASIEFIDYTQSTDDWNSDSWLPLTDLGAFLDWQAQRNSNS